MKDQPEISVWTKIAYGIGSVAYGVKNNGFDYFFLIFYSQVLGVDAELVGLALMLALAFDAISDPLVGYLSDNTHSRWGRRHPFMYAAALPVAAESITFEAESSIARPLLRRLASSTCHSRKPGSTCRQPSERRRSRWDAIHGGC